MRPRPSREPPGGTFGQACAGAGTSQVADLGAGSRAALSLPAPSSPPSPRTLLLCSGSRSRLPWAHSVSLPLHFFGLLLPFSSLAPFYRSPRLLHVEIPAPEKQSGDLSESGETNRASGPAGAEAESQPGALLRNVSARGNLPSPGVCQYD